MEESPCVFCAIVSGQIKSKPIYEDDVVLAVLDINPATRGHTIIIPKEHYNSIYEMPQPRYLSVLSITRAVAFALKLSTGCETVDLVYTQELRKGNRTPHAIIHAIPRYEDDTVNYVWQPTQLQENEADEMAASIKNAFQNVKNSETPEPVKQQPAEKPVPEKEEPKEEPLELKKKVVVF